MDPAGVVKRKKKSERGEREIKNERERERVPQSSQKEKIWTALDQDVEYILTSINSINIFWKHSNESFFLLRSR